MKVNWGPISEWCLVALVLLDSLIFYIFEARRYDKSNKTRDFGPLSQEPPKKSKNSA